MNEQKKIFIAALDWGLGHASRCIPVIETLINKGCNITIGGTGKSGILLKKEFPDSPYIEMPGFSPLLSAGKSQVLALLLNFPLLIYSSYREYIFIKKLQTKAKFDIIISDHRYGVHIKNAFNVMIIHQLRFIAPGILKPIGKMSVLMHKLLLIPYQQVWIPDFETQPVFSGDLSHGFELKSKYKYLGILSRFEGTAHSGSNNKKHVLALISGPEPQRSQFESILFNQFKDYSKPLIIVAGQPETMSRVNSQTNVTRFTHLQKDKLIGLIKDAELVVARSGYTTIMDLAILGVKALFVPTPGQTEQEYLARLMMESGYAFFVEQHKIDINQHIDKALEYKGFVFPLQRNNLCETVDVLLKGN